MFYGEGFLKFGGGGCLFLRIRPLEDPFPSFSLQYRFLHTWHTLAGTPQLLDCWTLTLVYINCHGNHVTQQVHTLRPQAPEPSASSQPQPKTGPKDSKSKPKAKNYLRPRPVISAATKEATHCDSQLPRPSSVLRLRDYRRLGTPCPFRLASMSTAASSFTGSMCWWMSDLSAGGFMIWYRVLGLFDLASRFFSCLLGYV